jgi:putative sugar O-methyltransferase
MGLKRQLAAKGNTLLRSLGAELIAIEEIEEYRSIQKKLLPEWGLAHPPGVPPENAAGYLRADNPRLSELAARYESANCPAFQHSIWGSHRMNDIELAWFRADNPYVFQWQDFNSEAAYILTTYYLQTRDRLGLLNTLKEDGRFGAHTYCFNGGILVSRDLLDSINEISFLDEALHISREPNYTVLDIGAGYGRLPYRLVSALPNLKRVFATDAFATSTFLSEFYLNYRGVSDRATVVPLDEIEETLKSQPVDCAVNIHSFSECTLTTVSWWLDLLSTCGVRYLLIVPNAKANEGTLLLTGELDASKPQNYLALLEKRGYRRISMQPKYQASSVQKYGISPTHYHLFELADWRPSL